MRPPPLPYFNLFQLDFDIKFPLLRLLLFLIDLKSTIVYQNSLILAFNTCFSTTQYPFRILYLHIDIQMVIVNWKTGFKRFYHINNNNNQICFQKKKYLFEGYKFPYRTRISGLKYIFAIFFETNQMLKYTFFFKIFTLPTILIENFL